MSAMKSDQRHSRVIRAIRRPVGVATRVWSIILSEMSGCHKLTIVVEAKNLDRVDDHETVITMRVHSVKPNVPNERITWTLRDGIGPAHRITNDETMVERSA